MAIIVTERDLDSLEQIPGPEGRFIRHQAYCALDCTSPLEIHAKLTPRLDEDTRRIYHFEMACLRAAMTMQLRGVLVDENVRAELIERFSRQEETACAKVAALAEDTWDRRVLRVGRCGDNRSHLWAPRGTDAAAQSCKRCGAGRLCAGQISATSHSQLAHLFYELWGVRTRRARGTGNPTTDKEALESIRSEFAVGPKAYIGEAADWALKGLHAQKQGSYARAKLDHDGRYRYMMNVGAAETGRWSASHSPIHSGGNIQQQADEIREMFVPDPGLEFFYADLEQAESHVVAKDSGDPNYIRAHSLADPHTAVCKLVWPELSWPGDSDWQTVYICDAAKHGPTCCDRGLAETSPTWDPYHSYRDYSKRIQHGGNMGRTPKGVARQIHVPEIVAAEVYARMYGGQNVDPVGGVRFSHPGAFPFIKARHRAIAAQVARTGVTISCFGRKRQFLGRTWDDETVREALGQLEQSPVADILDLSVVRIGDELDTRPNVWDAPHPDQPNKVWLLAQIHDAILGLYRPGDLETLRRVKELMTIPFMIEGRECCLGVEIAVGKSWAKKDLHKVKL